MSSVNDASRNGVRLLTGELMYLIPVGNTGDWPYLVPLLYFQIYFWGLFAIAFVFTCVYTVYGLIMLDHFQFYIWFHPTQGHQRQLSAVLSKCSEGCH